MISHRRRALALVLSATMLAASCSGGGGDDEQVVTTSPDRSTVTTATPTTRRVTSTTAAGDEGDATGETTGDDAERARVRAYQQRRIDAIRRMRDAIRRAQERERNKPPPPPPPPASPPPPAGPPPPAPVDPVEAARFRFIPLCAVEEEHSLLPLIDQNMIEGATQLELLSVLPNLLGPLLDFYDDAVPVAPSDLASQVAILTPFVAELRTTLLDLEAVGVVAGDEAWFEAIISTLLDNPEAGGALLSVIGEIDKFCR